MTPVNVVLILAGPFAVIGAVYGIANWAHRRDTRPDAATHASAHIGRALVQRAEAQRADLEAERRIIQRRKAQR